jgi:hypothetical protein
MYHNCNAVRCPSAGTCTSCSKNCSTCTAGSKGEICTSCMAGYSLVYPNSCLIMAIPVNALTGIWTYGPNSVPNAVVCQSTPLSIPVSPASAFQSITLTTNASSTTFLASNGRGFCFGCASTPPALMDAGYHTRDPNEVYTWQVSFQTRSTVQMCVSRPAVAPGTWSDTNLQIAYSIVAAPCSAGEYTDSNFICNKCKSADICTPPSTVVDVTYTGIYVIGANYWGSLLCGPVTMSALSSTAAFKNVTMENWDGPTVYAAAAGQCYGCMSQVMAPVVSGVETAFEFASFKLIVCRQCFNSRRSNLCFKRGRSFPCL